MSDSAWRGILTVPWSNVSGPSSPVGNSGKNDPKTSTLIFALRNLGLAFPSGLLCPRHSTQPACYALPSPAVGPGPPQRSARRSWRFSRCAGQPRSRLDVLVYPEEVLGGVLLR